MTTLLEFAVCDERPIVFRYEGRFFVLFRRCLHRAMEVDMSMSDAIQAAIVKVENFVTVRSDPPDHELSEWKLPDDPHSHLIEYRGRSIHFSPIPFKMMQLLIPRRSEPVTLSQFAQAGWGHFVSKPVVMKRVHALNLALKEERVPKTVRCKKEFAFLLPDDQVMFDAVTRADFVGLPR